MFYLHVHLPNDKRCFWLYTETIGTLVQGKLNTDAMYAEAFAPQHVEEFRNLTLTAWPGCECFPIECSSNKIIPENMRKVLNIA